MMAADSCQACSLKTNFTPCVLRSTNSRETARHGPKVGERRLAIVGIRDPYTIENLDKAMAWARARLAEALRTEAATGQP